MVSDHVGQGAATAADELRRGGLRPGIERVEAATPTELGIVVAQDPAAGASVQRNSVVTLYVGASVSGDETPAVVGDTDDAQAPAARARRRRKPPQHRPASEGDGDDDDRALVNPRSDRSPAPEGTGIAPDVRSDPLRAQASPTDATIAQPHGWAAPGLERVHHDPAGADDAGRDGDAWSHDPAETDAMLAPLPGLPARWSLAGGWRQLPRTARAAIAIVAAAVLISLGAAVAGPGSRPRPRRPTAPAATTAPLALPATAPRRRGPRAHGDPGRPAHRTPAPAPRSGGATARLTHQQQAPVAPALAVAPDPEPALPVAVPAPLSVDGQIPGGPFSP